MQNVAALRPAPSLMLKRFLNNDAFSSLVIMGMRVFMLAAKFILSIFIARYMGLEELGIYGLLVGASSTVQAVARGGIFRFLARDAVHQSLAELTDNLRHYGIGVACFYCLLIPLAIGAGLYFDALSLAALALAVFFTEHLVLDAFMLVNNLQYPKLANFVYSLQSASWIYLFVILAFFDPSFRSLEALLVFWVAGGVVALAISAWLSRRWPWKKAFGNRLELHWYIKKIKQSFKLYLADVTGIFGYYMDRYIVTVFLSLEMTGIYVFFSQIILAIINLLNYGVLAVYRPRLIKAYDRSNFAPFRETFRACLKRTYISAAGLMLFTALAVPVMVGFTDNPELSNHIPLFWAMLAVLLLQVGEVSAETGLYTMHKDHDNFIITLLVFLLTVSFGSAAVILLGVYGIILNAAFVALLSLAYARTIWKKGLLPLQETRKVIPGIFPQHSRPGGNSNEEPAANCIRARQILRQS